MRECHRRQIPCLGSTQRQLTGVDISPASAPLQRQVRLREVTLLGAREPLVGGQRSVGTSVHSQGRQQVIRTWVEIIVK